MRILAGFAAKAVLVLWVLVSMAGINPSSTFAQLVPIDTLIADVEAALPGEKALSSTTGEWRAPSTVVANNGADLSHLNPDSAGAFAGKGVVIVDISVLQENVYKMWAEWANSNPRPADGINGTMPALTQRVVQPWIQPDATAATLLNPDNWKTGDDIRRANRVPFPALCLWLKENVGVDYVVIRAAESQYILDQFSMERLVAARSANLRVYAYHKLTWSGDSDISDEAGRLADTTLRTIIGKSGELKDFVAGAVVVPSFDFAARAPSDGANSLVRKYFDKLDAKTDQNSRDRLRSRIAYMREGFGRKIDRDPFVVRDSLIIGNGPQQLSLLDTVFVPVFWGRNASKYTKSTDAVNQAIKYWADNARHNAAGSSQRRYVVVVQNDTNRVAADLQETHIPAALHRLGRIVSATHMPGNAFYNFKSGYEARPSLCFYKLDRANMKDWAAILLYGSDYNAWPENEAYPPAGSDAHAKITVAVRDFRTMYPSSATSYDFENFSIPRAVNDNENWCWANVASVALNYCGRTTTSQALYYTYFHRACSLPEPGGTLPPGEYDIREPECSGIAQVDLVLRQAGVLTDAFESGKVPPRRIYAHLNILNKKRLAILSYGDTNRVHFVIVLGVSDGGNDPKLLIYDPAVGRHGSAFVVDKNYFSPAVGRKLLGVSWVGI